MIKYPALTLCDCQQEGWRARLGSSTYFTKHCGLTPLVGNLKSLASLHRKINKKGLYFANHIALPETAFFSVQEDNNSFLIYFVNVSGKCEDGITRKVGWLRVQDELGTWRYNRPYNPDVYLETFQENERTPLDIAFGNSFVWKTFHPASQS